MGLVNTAEMYGNEEMVGEALEGQKGFFLATKVSPHHFKHDDLIRACRASLSKLNVRSIDLYQLHWPSGGVPIRETMSAMEQLVDEGLIRHIGISNFSVEETRAAQEAMKKYEIVSNQVEYSLLVQGDRAGRTGGLLQREQDHDNSLQSGGEGRHAWREPGKLSSALKEVGKRHGKTPAQVALNWVISHDNVVAIPKSSSSEHVAENAGASGWKMTDRERRVLEDAAVEKKSMAKRIKPFMSGMGFLSGAYQGSQTSRTGTVTAAPARPSPRRSSGPSPLPSRQPRPPFGSR